MWCDLAEGLTALWLPEKLADYGIPSRPYFSPIHLQPYMVDKFGYQRGDYPVTEMMGDRNMAIPFSGSMTNDQIDQVCKGLWDVLG